MTASEEEQHRVKIRRQQLTQMKIAGVDWQTIGDRLYNGNVQHAYEDWRRTKRAVDAQLQTTVEEARWLEVDRLDRIQAALWPKVVKGDTKAADTCHRVIVSRCKLLGLEAPTQIQLNARVDLESTIVAEAIIAAVDALGLDPSQRVIAFNAAQTRLEIVAAGDEDG